MATNALSYWQQLDSLVSQWKEQQRSGATTRRTAREAKISQKKSPMTVTEMMLVDKLQKDVNFPPGSSHKRFIGNLNLKSELTDRGRMYLSYIAHRYRRQWKPTQEEMEWIVTWGEWIEVKN